ncbi:phospholipid scramblase [Plakobranchus ocellatus]|uniref:Phospholipid scramblase n=1 Tax=Plakobranchus ocellatus TaxID=259542 RepID=A0AAV4DQ99_9GAST|nr:phospholipid scramblase [Plakobranchus ocellatus]
METAPKNVEQAPSSVITHESQMKVLSRTPCGDERSESESSIDAKWVANDHVTSLAAILESLDEVRVSQHLDVVEVCLCWERSNRYSLYNKQGEQILYTYEAAQCYARQCYGSLREFTLITTDNDDNRLLYLQRPARCSSRFFYACCCLQEMSIIIPPKDTLAVLKEKWSCCIPQYEMMDSDGNLKFILCGECGHFRMCNSIHFSVRNMDGTEVATIRKPWGGCSLKTLIGGSNSFTIKYLENLTKEEKVMILGSSFLLDFNYFERHGKCY